MAFVWRQGAQQVPRLRSPEFPVKLVGVGEPHAAFLTESRTRSHGWSHVQEIRVGMTKGEGSAHLSSRYEGWTDRRLFAINLSSRAKPRDLQCQSTPHQCPSVTAH